MYIWGGGNFSATYISFTPFLTPSPLQLLVVSGHGTGFLQHNKVFLRYFCTITTEIESPEY